MRISKYLSLCGVTSRRGAEQLIDKKQVTVNDQTIEKQGVIIDEAKDIVKVNGTQVSPVLSKVYVILNKPANCLTTLFDPFHRKTVVHYLKGLKERVYPVGRLDFDTEGVLLLSNDGDLTFRLAHPSYEIQRVYEASVLGRFTAEAVKEIHNGIELVGGASSTAEVSILGFEKNLTRIRLILHQGRKHEVKQLCKKVGHPVHKLRRVEFAGLTTKGLSGGGWRHLTITEVQRLKQSVGLDDRQ